MAGTVLDFVTAAMRLCNYIAAGQVPSNEEAQDVLGHLNRLLSAWNTERLNIFATRYDVFALGVGVQAYTLGTGGAWNMPRPLEIKSAVILVSGFEFKMEMASPERWAAERDKTLSGKLPQLLYNDVAFPLSTVKLLPIPTIAASIGLFTWQKFAAFAALTDAVAFPDGYEMAILYSLAVAIGAEFGVQVDPSIINQAQMYKQSLRDLNMPPTPGTAEEAAALARAGQAATGAGAPQQ